MEQSQINKNDLMDNISKDADILREIKSNFKNRSDSILYNNIQEKLKMFSTMLDEIDTKYYHKLDVQLKEIENTIKCLSTSEQELK